MNLLTRIIILFVSILTSISAQAGITKCVGMDSQGNTIHLLLDPKTETVNINTDILKIVAQTKDKKGIATEDYITDDGKVAYISLLPPDHNKIALIQFNAVTNKILATANLVCH